MPRSADWDFAQMAYERAKGLYPESRAFRDLFQYGAQWAYRELIAKGFPIKIMCPSCGKLMEAEPYVTFEDFAKVMTPGKMVFPSPSGYLFSCSCGGTIDVSVGEKNGEKTDSGGEEESSLPHHDSEVRDERPSMDTPTLLPGPRDGYPLGGLGRRS